MLKQGNDTESFLLRITRRLLVCNISQIILPCFRKVRGHYFERHFWQICLLTNSSQERIISNGDFSRSKAFITAFIFHTWIFPDYTWNSYLILSEISSRVCWRKKSRVRKDIDCELNESGAVRDIWKMCMHLLYFHEICAIHHLLGTHFYSIFIYMHWEWFVRILPNT